MNIVITMAGAGQRFKQAGYDQPKFMLEVKGRSLFRWSMTSLENLLPRCERLIFVVREDHRPADFIAAELDGLSAPAPIMHALTAPTDGQATSALQARTVWDPGQPLLIYNIDTYVDPNFITLERIKGDGWIPCFRAPGTHWSFVKLDGQGRAVDVREKEKISDFASIGLYWFSSADLYEQAYSAQYGNDQDTKQAERYIAPMYNNLIAWNHDVRISEVPLNAVIPLGTPDELRKFQAA